MAPDADKLIYKDYRKKTTQLLTWLIENARRCNITVPMESSETGTERKKQNRSHPVAALKDWKNLATCIANSTDPIIWIDPEILSLARLIIYLRRQATPGLARKNSRGDPAEYIGFARRHLHVVEVLEEILGILEAAALEARKPVEGRSDDTDATSMRARVGCALFFTGPEGRVVAVPIGTVTAEEDNAETEDEMEDNNNCAALVVDRFALASSEDDGIAVPMDPDEEEGDYYSEIEDAMDADHFDRLSALLAFCEYVDDIEEFDRFLYEYS